MAKFGSIFHLQAGTQVSSDLRRELLAWIVLHPHNVIDIRQALCNSPIREKKQELSNKATRRAERKKRANPKAGSTPKVGEPSETRPMHAALEKRLQKRQRLQFSMHELVG